MNCKRGLELVGHGRRRRSDRAHGCTRARATMTTVYCCSTPHHHHHYHLSYGTMQYYSVRAPYVTTCTTRSYRNNRRFRQITVTNGYWAHAIRRLEMEAEGHRRGVTRAWVRRCSVYLSPWLFVEPSPLGSPTARWAKGQ